MNSTLPDYFSLPVTRFLDDAANNQPAPGGGSVTSMSSAMGCSLIGMAAAYTLGNPRLTSVHQPVAELQRRLAEAQNLFRGFVTEDMEAYLAYHDARNLPADAPADRELRRQTTRAALAVPLQILALASSTLGLADELKDLASRSLLSDLLAGAHLLHGAAHAATANARLNLKQVDDPELARESRTQINRALSNANQRLDSIRSMITRTLDLPI